MENLLVCFSFSPLLLLLTSNPSILWNMLNDASNIEYYFIFNKHFFFRFAAFMLKIETEH